MSSLTKNVRKIHRWAGLVVGLQIVCWIAGGLIMSVLPIEQVRGVHLVENDSPVRNVIDRQVAAQILADQPVSALTGYTINDRDYIAATASGVTHYLDAKTGTPLASLDSAQAQALAVFYFIEQANVVETTLVEQKTVEARGLTPPFWSVTLDDSLNTTLYMHPITGELLKVRSDMWRLFDFVWMLHIMDYDERSNFNHWLLITFAAASLLFVFAGVWLLVDQIRRRKKRRAMIASAG